MKKAVLVFLAFCFVSLLLTIVWNEWLRGLYGDLLRTIAPPLYEATGFSGAPIRPLRDRYINFVPFLSLVIVTPGLAIRRRLLGLLLGTIALSLCHLALNLTERLDPGPSLPVVPAIVSDTLPFLFWLVVAYPALVRLLPGAVREEPGGAGTGGPDAEGEATGREEALERENSQAAAGEDER